MQPETQNDPQTPSVPPNPEVSTPPPVKSKKTVFIVVGISLAVLIIGIIAAIMIVVGTKKPSDSQNGVVSTAGMLTVGNNPYVYGCSVLLRDDVAAIHPALSSDKIGESMDTAQVIPYEAITDKKYDLLTTKEETFGNDTITSECNLTSDVGNIRKTLSIDLHQYKDETAAKTHFTQSKQYSDATSSLASFKNTSYIEPAREKYRADDLDQATAWLLNKNVVMEINYEMGDVTATTAGQKLDPLAKQLVKNMNDTAKSSKPHDFTNAGKIGDKAFVDACHSVDFRKISSALGTIDYERSDVKGDYSYGRFDAAAATLHSDCEVKFRYPEDKDKLPKPEKGRSSSVLDEIKRYPGNVDVEVTSYADAASAQTALSREKQELPKKTLLTPRDFQLGTVSLAFDQSSDYSDTKSLRQVYKTVVDNSVVVLSISQDSFDTPYKSTVKVISDEQIKAIFASLKL